MDWYGYQLMVRWTNYQETSIQRTQMGLQKWRLRRTYGWRVKWQGRNKRSVDASKLKSLGDAGSWKVERTRRISREEVLRKGRGGKEVKIWAGCSMRGVAIQRRGRILFFYWSVLQGESTDCLFRQLLKYSDWPSWGSTLTVRFCQAVPSCWKIA